MQRLHIQLCSPLTPFLLLLSAFSLIQHPDAENRKLQGEHQTIFCKKKFVFIFYYLFLFFCFCSREWKGLARHAMLRVRNSFRFHFYFFFSNVFILVIVARRPFSASRYILSSAPPFFFLVSVFSSTCEPRLLFTHTSSSVILE